MTWKSVEEQFALLADGLVDLHSAAELKERLAAAVKENRPLRVKLGADPSAPDLHLGHGVVMRKLRQFQDCGHTVVFIIGDFTGMIGDPSGKSATRPQLTREQVLANAKTYQEQVFRVLKPEQTEIRFNSEWFGTMTFDEVIRIAAKVTIAQLLARDDFSKRYAAHQPISLTEFLYPLIQSYDSVMVKADVELGGTDQLFNLLLGREIQKAYSQLPQIVMTLPLLVGLDGVQKMSKSLGNYIAFTDPAREVFGKAMSIPDECMWTYWRLVVGRSEEETAAMKADLEAGRTHPRESKDALGRAIVAMLYDAAAASAASEEFTRIFSQKELPDEIPEVTLPAEEIGVLTLLVQANLAASTGEARRLIQGGAVKIGDDKITDVKLHLTPVDGTVIRSGKRGFARIRTA